MFYFMTVSKDRTTVIGDEINKAGHENSRVQIIALEVK